MTNKTADTQTRDWYWAVVRKCLVEFHSFKPVSAAELQVRVAESFPQLPHHGPFAFSCDLARKSLNFEEHRKRYQRIKEEAETEVQNTPPGKSGKSPERFSKSLYPTGIVIQEGAIKDILYPGQTKHSAEYSSKKVGARLKKRAHKKEEGR
jgi:hypothetical protein